MVETIFKLGAASKISLCTASTQGLFSFNDAPWQMGRLANWWKTVILSTLYLFVTYHLVYKDVMLYDSV